MLLILAFAMTAMMNFQSSNVITNQIQRPILNGVANGEILIENIQIYWLYIRATDILTYTIAILWK